MQKIKAIYSNIYLGLVVLFPTSAVLPAIPYGIAPLHAPQPPGGAFHFCRDEQKANKSLPPTDNLFSLSANPYSQGCQIGMLQPPSAPIAQLNADNLLEQGRTLYEAGRFYEAAAVWKQAAEEFDRRGDKIGQAWSLSYLSLAYQNLGQWEAAKNSIDASLNLLQQPNQREGMRILAQAFNTRGSLLLATGKTEAALDSWQQAEAAYKKAGDNVGMLGSRINQAQALQTLGLYRRSQALLTSVSQQLQAQPDSPLKAQSLRSLGVALQVVGELRRSREVLAQSLAIAQSLDSPKDIAKALFSLGNTARDMKELELALNYYQQAADLANSGNNIESLLNLLSLSIEMNQKTQAESLLLPVEAKIANLPASRLSVYAGVNFAKSLADLSRYRYAAKILAIALQQARSLGDLRAEAHALTQLGSVYEQTQQQAEALQLTERALAIAQSINAGDITARASRQLGRVLKQQGDIEGAIAAYSSAVKTLQSLRSDLAAINSDVQFSFTESIEPVYRELVGLLLLREAPTQNHLKQAREVIESLQLAELDNFFREACLDAAKPVKIDEIDPTAAVIYPIVLSDRVEVILSLPGQPLRNYKTAVPRQEVEKILRRMRSSLNPAFSNEERLQLYQQVYNWLVRPAKAELAAREIKTLVFVLDGFLRNLPMGALHDGEQYLVEKYSIALSQGLQLLSPRSLPPGQIKAIAAGLSEARQGFNALPAVKSEVAQISAELSGKVLLDRDFTDANLKKAIGSNPYPILHLATHGQFSSNAEDTFILTWDGRINVRELDELLRVRGGGDRNPIELLVLSACQTAKGDSRAALGLAGVAIRSGARSTLATLWAVRDRSTAQFMAEFYKQLSSGARKAEALRSAQLALLKDSQYHHPFYWAPFVLVGNWL